MSDPLISKVTERSRTAVRAIRCSIKEVGNSDGFKFMEINWTRIFGIISLDNMSDEHDVGHRLAKNEMKTY